jgi:2-methylisocitrate lyase-like PEP mutase family enzyme
MEAIQLVCASVSKPVNVLMGLKGATYTVEAIAAAGAKRISVGGSLARAALGAFVRAAREIREQGTFTYAADAIPHAEVNEYMR